jgi:hypothetical protein
MARPTRAEGGGTAVSPRGPSPDDDHAVRTDADFDTMSWHDATIYAISLVPSGEFFSRVAFDLDFIVAWVYPPSPEAESGVRTGIVYSPMGQVGLWVEGDEPPAVDAEGDTALAAHRLFRFWVSPATLVFDEIWNLRCDVDLGVFRSLQLENLTREPVVDRWGGFDWCFEGRNFEMRFRSLGYRQILRRRPALIGTQTVDLTQRGGMSFDEKPYPLRD